MFQAESNGKCEMKQKSSVWQNRAFVLAFLVLTLLCWCPLGYGAYGPVQRGLGIPYWAVMALAVLIGLFGCSDDSGQAKHSEHTPAATNSPDITLSIEKPLGTSLSSKTLPVSAINSGTCDWVTFDIPDINLIVGATYYIVISYPPGGEYGWCGAWGNPYASGVSDVDPDWDYTFRTIVEKARPRIVNIFINFLENHPNLFPMLRQLLKL